jgi:lysophospholipase L1-like esterase
VPKLLRRALLFGLGGLAAAEGGIAWWHLQRSPEAGSSIAWLAGRLHARWQAAQLDRDIRTSLRGVSPGRFEEAVFAVNPLPEALAVRQELDERYRAAFLTLFRAVEARGARLVLFYPPMAPPGTNRGRQLFTELAQKFRLPLVEPDAMRRLPLEIAFLLPIDIHPSRYGHRLMAEALAGALAPLALLRAPDLPPGVSPGRLGDLPPNGADAIVRTVPAYPYLLATNGQGLRMPERVPRNADRQVVLLLGDSFTSGTSMAPEDIYPALLARLLPGRLIVNAGVGGFGIEEEASLFGEFWGAARADIVVLQLLDNDIEALLWYRSANASRHRAARPPSTAELRLLDRLVDG